MQILMSPSLLGENNTRALLGTLKVGKNCAQAYTAIVSSLHPARISISCRLICRLRLFLDQGRSWIHDPISLVANSLLHMYFLFSMCIISLFLDLGTCFTCLQFDIVDLSCGGVRGSNWLFGHYIWWHNNAFYILPLMWTPDKNVLAVFTCVTPYLVHLFPSHKILGLL